MIFLHIISDGNGIVGYYIQCYKEIFTTSNFKNSKSMKGGLDIIMFMS